MWKRIPKEIDEIAILAKSVNLPKPFFEEKDNSIISVTIYMGNSKYMLSDFARYPFTMPNVRISNPDIDNKNWLTREFSIENKNYPQFPISRNGEISINNRDFWSPQMKLIDIITIIERAILNKEEM